MHFDIKRHIKNNAVVIVLALPNLAITASSIAILNYFHTWIGFLAEIPYLIGQIFSVQYSAFFGQATEMTFKIGNKTYYFSKEKKQTHESKS